MQIHLGFPEAAAGLTPGRATEVFVSGNPIEPPIPPASRPSRVEIERSWGFAPGDRPVMVVAGGSQGAEAINRVVAAWLRVERGDARPRVIWATGPGELRSLFITRERRRPGTAVHFADEPRIPRCRFRALACRRDEYRGACRVGHPGDSGPASDCGRRPSDRQRSRDREGRSRSNDPAARPRRNDARRREFGASPRTRTHSERCATGASRARDPTRHKTLPLTYLHCGASSDFFSAVGCD